MLHTTERAAGTVVRLTGKYLRNTGQIAGGEGRKRWKIQACGCVLCRDPHDGGFVAVNEPALDYGQWDDIPPAERPKWRHFAAANLQPVGRPVRADEQP